MSRRIRSGTAAEWAAAEAAGRVLRRGEQGWDETNAVMKIGDGATPWSQLPVAGEAVANAQAAAVVAGAPAAGDTLAELHARLAVMEARRGGLDEYPVYGINSGGSGTLVLGTGTAEVPNSLITIGPSNDEDVWLEAQMIFQQTALGNGSVLLYIYETTGLAAANYGNVVATFVAALPNATGTASKWGQVNGRKRLGRVTSERTFKMAAAASAANLASGYFSAPCPSFLGAFVP